MVKQAESIRSVIVSNFISTSQISVNLLELIVTPFSGDPIKFLELFNSFESAID